MKIVSLLCLLVVISGFSASAQVSLTTMGSAYTQDFNTLASTGTSSTLPTGWALNEAGGNTTYTAGTGSSATGDTYSFGTSPADRAFGCLQSGSNIPTIGASFTNNTGAAIESLVVIYTGEEWRLGARNRFDSLQFQMSLDATSLTTGTWTRYTSLDFATPDTAAPTGAKDGNTGPERSSKTYTITGLNISNGSTFWIRWSDFNVSGSDDGLAVDDFSLTPYVGSSSTNPSGVGAANPSTVNAGSMTVLTVKVTPGTNPTSTGIAVNANLSAIGGSSSQTLYDDGSNGDTTASDNTFTYLATVSGGTSAGAKSLPDTISDGQARSTAGSIALTVTVPPPVDSIVISQIYGAGGNASAAYLNDYIELFNRSNTTYNLAGWSIQYASATGSSWSQTDLSGSIAPGKYLLIQEASGGAVGLALPAAEDTGTIAMAAAAGKVALVMSTTLLTGSCPTGGNLVDFVGYGATANCFEGTGPTAAPGTANAVFRNSSGCTDNNDNAGDFTASAAAPRNSASAANICGVTGASLSLAPSGNNFGNVRTGLNSASFLFTLTNTGGNASGTISTSITGADSGQFTITADTCNGASLPGGGGCAIAVRFNPTSTGVKSATLTVSASPGGSSSVPLSGTGIAPALTITPANLAFGNQRVSTTSAPTTVTLRNSGTDVLQISSIMISSGGADYILTGPVSLSLAAGDSASVDVAFKPTSLGLKNGSLKITDDAEDSPQFVPMTGTGVVPIAHFDSSSLNFGNTALRDTSVSHVVMLKNVGNDVLNITSVSISAGDSDFSIQSNLCSPTLAPNQSCAISVRFAPAAAGLRSGTLRVIDDASGSPHDIPLSGTGIVAPIARFDTPSWDFGGVRTTSEWSSTQIMLKNTGTAPLHISSIAIISGNSDFSQTHTCPATLDTGQDCGIEVVFDPTALGVRTGTLRIIDDATDSPQDIPLSGTGVASGASFDSSSLNFGTHSREGIGKTKSLVITSTGNARLNFMSITIAEGDSDFSVAQACTSLATGEQCTIDITFSPAALGMRTGKLRIIDDSPDSVHDIPLTGEGIPGPPFSICGFKFEDYNGNGIYEPGSGEGPMAGWKFYALDMAGDTLTTTTDSTGKYCFTGLVDSVYEVFEELPAGYMQTAGLPSYTITKDTAGVDSIWFGNFKTGAISGTKFVDANTNGANDNEPGLSDWQITLSTSTFPSSIDFRHVTLTAHVNLAGSGLQTISVPAYIAYSSQDMPGAVPRSRFLPRPEVHQISRLVMMRVFAVLSNSGSYGIRAMDSDLRASSSRARRMGVVGVQEPSDGVNVPLTIIDKSGASDRGLLPHGEVHFSGTIDQDPIPVGSVFTANNIALYDSTGQQAGTIDSATITIGDPITPGSPAVTQTDAAGGYVFRPLFPGIYDVHESQQTGWTQTTQDPPPVIILSGAIANNVDFGNVRPADTVRYRSFRYDSLAYEKDNLGKPGKPVKRKAVRSDFSFTIIPTANVNDLHVEFDQAIDQAFPFTVSPAAAATNPDGKGKKWTYVFSSLVHSGDSVTVSGFGNKGKPIKVSKYYWTLNGTVIGDKLKNPVFTRNVAKFPMPNRINALVETFEQGGFQSTSGLLVGVNKSVPIDSSKQYGWLLSPKYTDVLKTLRDKTGLHTGIVTSAARGFFFFTSNGKPLIKRQKSLPPGKFNYKLLAELVALKINIAASQLSKTPVGFGELIYDDSTSTPPAPFSGLPHVNSLNGMMVKDISAYGDSLMMGYYSGGAHTFYPESVYEVLDYAAFRINSAFEGPLDTLDFGTKLHFKGMRPLIDVPYLKANTGIPPTVIAESPVPISQVPDAYELHQNYPNPFNPATTISFELPEEALVTLKVYNVLGQEVATLMDQEQMEEGSQEVEFNAGNLASGVYFYRIVAQGFDDDGNVASSKFTSVMKMMLLK
ncbi:MAG TPA: choice-of-anchor D domain-containing protein [Bacteroidota bacterium]|nr:choice-of-anchor D domain-containing protein [Bacteroidota bacterium]